MAGRTLAEAGFPQPAPLSAAAPNTAQGWAGDGHQGDSGDDERGEIFTPKQDLVPGPPSHWVTLANAPPNPKPQSSLWKMGEGINTTHTFSHELRGKRALQTVKW